MARKRIVWQSWIDPLCGNIDKYYPKSVLEDKNTNEDENDEYSDDSEEAFQKKIMQMAEDEKMSPADMIRENREKSSKVLMSPIGMIPVMDHHYISDNFNLWIGHTNFDITPNIANTIQKIEGVETLEIYTRYRFRIGIGRAFDFNEVRLKIEDVICGKRDYKYNLTPELELDVKETINTLKQTHKYWAFCLFPNGEKKIIHSKVKTDIFEESLHELEIIEKACGGVVYSYDD